MTIRYRGPAGRSRRLRAATGASLGPVMCAALLAGAVAGWTAGPAGAVEVIEHSITPQGGQAAAQGGDAGTPQPAAPVSASGGGRPQSLEARVERMEHMLEGGTLVDMLDRLDSLQQQLQKMQGDLDVERHDMEALREHQRDLYLDLDRRLRQLETQAPAGAAPGTAPGGAEGGQAAVGGAAKAAGAAGQPPPGGTPQTAAGEPPAESVAPPAVDQQQMQADYDHAFKLLRGAQYQDAIGAFQQFLQKYPQGPLSDNAQYWLGEANYVMRRFPEALKDFQLVVSRYPGSAKVPDAELKVGFTHYELDQWDDARKALDGVIKQYPESTAAKLAQNRLQRMKQEGH